MQERLQRSVKPALILGFGMTLVLWLFVGVHFTRRVTVVQRDVTAINDRYMRAQDLLSVVRTQVLLASVYVRDALLDMNPEATDLYRRRVDRSHTVIEDALGRYVPVLDSPAERDQLAVLRREIGEFQRTLTEVLGRDNNNVTPELRLALSRQVVAKREIAVQVSEEVQTTNRRAFVEQQASLADGYRWMEQGIWQQLGLALAGSLGIGLIATLYAGRLENKLAHERRKEIQNSQDLQRLSAKLITAGEEERRTIARELHDEVGQVLTAIKVELSIGQRAIEAAGGNRRLLEGAQTITDGALHTVRDLSRLLHPAMLDDLGLPAAIDWYLRTFGTRYGLRVELLHDHMDERLPSETETNAYRIVQEALTNVARHAQATECRVYLQRLPNTVLITIEDNGVGFDQVDGERSESPAGLGLIGIRERVWQQRGTLHIESAPGTGTRLTVELSARPLQDSPPEESVAPRAAAVSLASSSVLNA